MNMSILIVDDSSMARSIIRRSLEICGLQNIDYQEASDGREALELLKSGTAVDVIFSDLNMPNMGGEQLLKHVKGSPRFHDIPVVIITSLYSDFKKNNLLAEHAAAVLQKPVTIPQLNEILAEPLGLLGGDDLDLEGDEFDLGGEDYEL